MKNLTLFLFSVLLFFAASCASTGQLDPARAEWQQIPLERFPNLVRDTAGVEGYFENYELNLTSFLQRREVLQDYKEGYGCSSSGLSTLQFVISADARIRTPRVVVSRGEACDNALLLYLKGVRVNEPARINGRPVPILVTLDISLDTSSPE